MQHQRHRSDAHPASVSPAILSGIPIVYGHMRRTPLLLLVTMAALLTLSGTAGAITLDEYSRGISADPHSIVRGSDGAMWFAETGTAYGDGPGPAIGRIDGTGQVQEFREGLESTSNPWDLVPGRDGALWFVDGGTRRIGRVTPAGAIREFSTGLRKTQWLQGVAPNRDGSMTFVADGGETIGRMTSSGHVRRWKRALPRGTSRKNASVVSPGPDGRPWVASGRMRGVIEPGTGRVRWRAAGFLEDMVRGTGGTMWLRGGALVHVDRHGRTLATYKESRLAEASAMVATPDGHLWLTSGSTEQIIEISGSRITKHGPGLRPDEGPHGLDPSSIGVDGDGQLWVTGNQRVARIVRTPACRVPDVIAMSERDAVAAVTAAGCSAVVTHEDSGGDGPVGVSAQSVERRRVLPTGGEVRLTVDHLADACRWPEDATVRAIPGGLVGTYEVEVILNTFEQRKDVCLPTVPSMPKRSPARSSCWDNRWATSTGATTTSRSSTHAPGSR